MIRLQNPTGRLPRSAVRLQPFFFDIIHRKGKDNVVPDFLSRSVSVLVDAVEINTVDWGEITDRWYTGMMEKVNSKPHKYPQWRVENNLLYRYAKYQIPELSTESDYWKIVVPKDQWKALLKRYHDNATSGHVDSFKVYWKLRQRYIWPKMSADVIRYVKSCTVCAEQKSEQRPPAGIMSSKPQVERPWQMRSLDFVGLLHRNTRGYCYILVVSDYFSKYVVLFPLRSATAEMLCRKIEGKIFLTYGVPEILICDSDA